MDFTTRRLFIAGLWILPYVLLVGLIQDGSTVFAAGLALSAIASLAAALFSVRWQQASLRTSRPMMASGLLRPDFPASREADLPDHPQRQVALARALAAGLAQDHVGPDSPEMAIARILRRSMQSWSGRPANCDPHSLSPVESRVLYLLLTILQADRGEAGRIAQGFRHPHKVLRLRDEIDAIAHQRALFDRDRNAYLATDQLWSEVQSARGPDDLTTALKALPVPDIDLWHHVVARHNLSDAVQRRAALWCLSQRLCERATVATFFARLTLTDFLVDAARAGDTADLDAIRQIIEAWNNGFYRGGDIGLSPSDAVTELAPRCTMMLDRLAEVTRDRRWPDPHGVFTDYPGRAPRPRPAWDLQTGKLRRAPTLSDYVETGFTRV